MGEWAVDIDGISYTILGEIRGESGNLAILSRNGLPDCEVVIYDCGSLERIETVRIHRKHEVVQKLSEQNYGRRTFDGKMVLNHNEF